MEFGFLQVGFDVSRMDFGPPGWNFVPLGWISVLPGLPGDPALPELLPQLALEFQLGTVGI